jgi:hypothetical protein
MKSSNYFEGVCTNNEYVRKATFAGVFYEQNPESWSAFSNRGRAIFHRAHQGRAIGLLWQKSREIGCLGMDQPRAGILSRFWSEEAIGKRHRPDRLGERHSAQSGR